MPPKKPVMQPCRYFQLGKCQKGDKCTYAHEHDPDFKRRACQYFAFGKCHRGKDCGFSHEKEAISLLKATSGGGAGEGSSGGPSSEKLFRDWRSYIPSSGESKPLGQAMTPFCKGAAELVSGEIGQMQEVIAMLASQGGLQRILELTAKDLAQLTEHQLRRIFDNQILPLFKAITHKNVISSIILVPRLMTIYNILYGGDGEQAARMFGAVSSVLQAMTLTDPNDENAVDVESIDVIETCLTAFAKLVEVNTEAQIHDGLKLVAESLAQLFEDHASPAVKFALKAAHRHLKRIEQRLGLGQALPDAAINPGGTPSVRAVFHLSRELPGELSADGPRHDNDKVDIREISILPTLEEIQSSRNEYLPLADPLEWHIGGLEGLLDRHFRLLREDTVGQLRDAAKVELERLQDPNAYDRRDQRGRQGARTFVYENVLVHDVTFSSYTGMEFVLSFDQPKTLCNRDMHARSDWWQNSKRLGHEALICLLSSAGSATFLLALTEHSKSNKENTDNSQPLHKRYDLWSNPERAHVIAKPVNGIDIQLLLNQLQYSGFEQLSLVEFPGVLLPAFKPTLEAMQHMSETLDVPFAHILAPLSTPSNPDREIDVLPPEYATRPGFHFDLSSITDGGSRMDLTPGQLQNTLSIDLAAKSSLDPGQARAVVSSLSRSLALIQGPPGTGKSYAGVQLIKILLQNKKAGTLGPIITVCFTNHALDASLERLLDEGVEQIVRVGGSSKSSKLADVNLRTVAQRLDLTKTEKSERWQLNKKATEEAREINNIITSMSQLGTQESVKDLLRRQSPDHYTQLFSAVDEEGFVLVDYGRDNIIEQWLRAAPWGRNMPRTIDELQDENVNVMTGHERRVLYDYWCQETSQDLKRRLNTALQSYNEIKANLDDIRTELDLRVLRQANIIGITTSGLARNLGLLRRIDAKVLVCEEAGEVLESHLLTALLPSVQHAVLIGDHLQLRPRVQNYDLSTESKNGQQYSLDVSLFERLVQPSDDLASPLPYCSLEVQRRMHPSISQLVRDTLYPRLQDAPSVAQYPEVVGMKRRLFWCHHEHPEKQSDDAGTSHSNFFEVDMVAALVKHLVGQGVYRPDEIAVLTPYLGQLRMIRKRLAGSYQILLNDRDIDDLNKEGIIEEDDASTGLAQRRTSVARGTLIQAMRLATVDNFQGEEAKVVVVSLVRSNKHNKPGFLKTANRINVLLSRAQHGMYVIGNANTTESVKMWADVLQIFKDDCNFGTSLELCCPRHKDTPIRVTVPEDFVRLAPEAGCDLPCDKQLACGHACVSKCHSEMLHDAVFCMKQCQRSTPGCKHTCPLPCGKPCHEQCMVVVENVKVQLPCGHEKTSLFCCQSQDPAKVVCKVPVERTVPGCGHKVTEQCHVSVNSDLYRCMAPCDEILPCGHACSRPCSQCNTREAETVTRTDHGKCKQKCQRDYTSCKHSCQATCHGDEPCPLCNAKCEIRCAHSACDKNCCEPCAPCAEPICSSHCPHSQCRMPCAAPCDWLPCSQRCPNMLSCGCQCPGVCGEQCPDVFFCQNHANEETKAMQADFIMFEPYVDINLDDDPCIFTSCGHIVTVSSLDGYMEMSRLYEFDAKGRVVALRTTSKPFEFQDSSVPGDDGDLKTKLKTCPHCRGPLRDISRYGRVVRRALLDDSVQKFTALSTRTHSALETRLAEVQGRLLTSLSVLRKPKQDIVLDGAAEDQLKAVRRLRTANRYNQLLDVRNRIARFAESVKANQQPFQRVRDLVETARRTEPYSDIAEFQVSSGEVSLREHLKAVALLLRADIVLLSDVIQVHEQTAPAPAKGVIAARFHTYRDRCEELSKEAHATKDLREEVEGHLFYARFAAMEIGTHSTYTPALQTYIDRLKEAASARLGVADKICNRFEADDAINPTKGLSEEIAEVKRMLSEGLSSSEMRMVVQAMTAEFGSATGHWYRCENGHAFSVGECGRPMEEARCYACGAGVGGRSHVPTAGVQEGLGQRFANLNI